ncbi:YqgQ family protein [Staphylococcus massiliensis]|uniref:Cytosolic protein n=1 Tax=Staphylococcus massiliensis S46 TaxID=1229783 RepID=K9ARK6_9STAP|nr:YqgQ family protein [Staphylococcus massiliensis]EKU49879.1 hypothetical protein C273_03255 [Staphylococcus massiliensis S46]MCG3398983.1 YqgQ family protein [Staphylococcus massiliensis]MCG3401018.1 YqgQ family protein [Staphylococcus massiliensis]MCG3413032.1 YqgQ family protein [Staphylococcus massiliensis]POA02028.1 DUF910 domain-containing protein [Staphylococcus massiliensis CCUG 55927]
MKNNQLKEFYDVLQLLKQFGYVSYMKNPLDHLELIEQEIHELRDFHLISNQTFIEAKLLINQRRMELK